MLADLGYHVLASWRGPHGRPQIALTACPAWQGKSLQFRAMGAHEGFTVSRSQLLISPIRVSFFHFGLNQICKTSSHAKLSGKITAFRL